MTPHASAGPTPPVLRVRAFVAPDGNAFMADLASWLVEAGAELGHETELVADGRVPTDLDGAGDRDTIDFVVAPHEFWWLGDHDDRTIHANARLSVPVCTEQPGTTWFEMTSLLCTASPHVLDINAHGVEALRAAGHDARHLRLGGVTSMDRRTAVEGRSTDVVFLGGRTPYRAARLADLGPLLWDRRADLRLFSFSRPVSEPVGGVVFGRAKYELLARSRILLNVHRDEPGAAPGYFEWARMVEAMANGVCVVTEPSSGHEPLVPGEHFVMSDDVVGAVQDLLDDPDRVTTIGSAAAEAVLDRHRLAHSLRGALDAIVDGRVAARAPGRRRRTRPRYRSQLRRAQQFPLLPAFRPHREIRRRIHDAMSAEVRLQRRVESTRATLRHGDADHVTEVATAAHATAAPRISVVVTLFGYADLVVETLDSLAGSTGVDLSDEVEIIVVDDHSRDEGRAVVAAYLDEHPELALLLLGRDANRGLAAARNLGFERARGEYVMVMDADNLVYPTALRRLADALDADPDAAFAYSILEEFGVRRGLTSAMGWHVPWLCEANYVDAQAMLRRSAWERLGGYRSDDLAFGWEDWDLWLRFAVAGDHGVHVPEILGRYRTQEGSMIATSNLFQDVMLDHLRERYPELPWPTER